MKRGALSPSKRRPRPFSLSATHWFSSSLWRAASIHCWTRLSALVTLTFGLPPNSGGRTCCCTLTSWADCCWETHETTWNGGSVRSIVSFSFLLVRLASASTLSQREEKTWNASDCSATREWGPSPFPFTQSLRTMLFPRALEIRSGWKLFPQ